MAAVRPEWLTGRLCHQWRSQLNCPRNSTVNIQSGIKFHLEKNIIRPLWRPRPGFGGRGRTLAAAAGLWHADPWGICVYFAPHVSRRVGKGGSTIKNFILICWFLKHEVTRKKLHLCLIYCWEFLKIVISNFWIYAEFNRVFLDEAVISIYN